MASRGKHLLEAFKAAGPGIPTPPSAPPAPAPPSRSSANSASGGSAHASPARPLGGASSNWSASAARPSASGSMPPGALVLNGAQIRLLALVAFLAVVVAFLLGRMSVSRPALAADPDVQENREDSTTGQASLGALPAPPPAAPAAQPNAPPVDPNPRTPAELALLDTANVYTVKLVHYSNTEVNQRLAAETARYVIGTHNMPAVVAADSTGLFILVGAAPRQVDLDDFLARCKKMPGPPPLSRPGEFHTAFIEKIDRVFKRER